MTTDFGTADGYVGAMKGTIACFAPAACLLDLTHEIPPQDVRAAAFALQRAVPYYPRRTVHCAVVDPGVGTPRRPLALRVPEDQFLVGPDSGVFTLFLPPFVDDEPEAVELTEPEWWRAPVEISATFHGRDIFAPVAAHLARLLDEGTVPDLTTFGRRAHELARFDMPVPVEDRDGYRGEVVTVDHFGNAVTNLSAPWVAKSGDHAFVDIGDREIPLVRTYGDVAVGELCALVNSSGWLEVAEREGSAAERLGLAPGIPVVIRRRGR